MTIATDRLPIVLPGQDQLPCSDGVPMETQRHKMQMDLLLETLYPWLAARDNGYIGGNMFVYYSSSQLKNQDFKGPDFFAVLDVPKAERKSWVLWEEGKSPDVVIELLSESTAEQDKNGKKLVYQDQMRVPEYFWYDPFDPADWRGFRLVGGVYQGMELDGADRYISEKLGLALVRWSGDYNDVEAVWLRWATLAGVLMPTRAELLRQAQAQAEESRVQAEEAQAQAEEAQAQADRLAAKLREMGVDPDNF
jgi:Uma2 family endonuclease